MSKESELEDIGKTLTKFRSIREQNNITITGKPWIDGIIWGRSSPLSLSKIRLNITYMPAPMIEKILNELNKEYEINIIKMSSESEFDDEENLPVEDIGAETVYMYISSNEPIFRNLPKTRGERKISIENDIEFIEGYLQSIMHSVSGNDLRIYPVQNTKEDIVKILTFLQIEFYENPTLFYIKNPINNTNLIIKRYSAFLEEEENYLRYEEELQDETDRIKESIYFTENRLKKREEILKKRKLLQLLDDELLNIIFDRSNRLKKSALEEIRCRKNSQTYISEKIRTIYQENLFHLKKNPISSNAKVIHYNPNGISTTVDPKKNPISSNVKVLHYNPNGTKLATTVDMYGLTDMKIAKIERRIETEIISILFEWNKLEILNDLQDKFIHRVNRDLALKYIKILRRKLKRLDGWLNI